MRAWVNKHDAWNLFKDKAGAEIIDAHPHIKHLANKVIYYLCSRYLYFRPRLNYACRISYFEPKLAMLYIYSKNTYEKCLNKQMVAECRGLPSALCTLGRAMSTKRDVKEWRYAYDVLLKCKSPHHQVDEIQEMDDDGYSHLHQLENTLHDSFLLDGPEMPANV
jgi:hypothetical protein